MEHSVNLGERLTRINKIELEKLFSPIIIDKEDKQEKELPKKYKKEDCYTLSQVSEKFGVNPSTVTSIIHPNNSCIIIYAIYFFVICMIRKFYQIYCLSYERCYNIIYF